MSVLAMRSHFYSSMGPLEGSMRLECEMCVLPNAFTFAQGWSRSNDIIMPLQFATDALANVLTSTQAWSRLNDPCVFTLRWVSLLARSLLLKHGAARMIYASSVCDGCPC